MDPVENTITNVPDFLKLADQLRRSWFPHERTWGPWFRGHSVASWSLQPKLYRYSPVERDLRTIEDELRQEFVMRAPSLTTEKPGNVWDWYFVMQHSGCPTRLLDWTEGALIALYFSVRDGQKSNDAAVWALDPWWLNRIVVGEREVIAPSAEGGLLSTDADRYSPWLPPRFDQSATLKDLPVAIYPTHTARRIGTQRSCFTIHGSARDGLEDLRRKPEARIVRILIPASSISSIEQETCDGRNRRGHRLPRSGWPRTFSNLRSAGRVDAMIEFRKINLSDERKTVQQIDQKIFADLPGDFFEEDDWNYFESFWMLEDGVIVGCSAFMHNVDYDETPRPGCLYIVSTGVLPEMRSRGLGRKQKEWQIEYAKSRDFDVIVTNMRQSNTRMIHLNQQLGFEFREIHPEFYDEPKEDAVIMERRIKSQDGGR